MTEQERAEDNKRFDDIFGGATDPDAIDQPIAPTYEKPAFVAKQTETIVEAFEDEDGSPIYVERTVETSDEEIDADEETEDEIDYNGHTIIVIGSHARGYKFEVILEDGRESEQFGYYGTKELAELEAHTHIEHMIEYGEDDE